MPPPRSAGLGDDFDDVNSLLGDDPTQVSELVVTASPSVNVSPIAPLLSPDIVLSPPTQIYDAFDDPTFASNEVSPVITPLGATSNPISNFIANLFPKAPKGSPTSSGSGPISSNVSLQPPKAVGTTPANGALMANPALAAGLALAGLIFAAALLSGHHDRRGSARRR
jgi:hypothetical protein